MFDRAPKAADRSRATAGVSLLSALRVFAGVMAAAAVASLALEFGFDDPPLPDAALVATQVLAAISYLVLRAAELITATSKAAALRRMWLDIALIAVVLVYPFVQMEFSSRASEPVLKLSTLYISVMQAALAVRLSIEAIRLNLVISRSGLHPSRFMVVTFSGLILAGTLALALPRATTERLEADPDFSIPRHMLNCGFTATSAVCVTGLVVYDTEKDFTRFGQWVIMLLIQAGGLGIMVSGSLLSVLAQRQLSLRQSLAIQDAFSYRTLGSIRHMVIFIVVATFAIELVGAVLLYPMFAHIEDTWLRIFYSVFHAVSAFCNAGFALQSDNLIAFRAHYPVYTSIMPLIFLGGLGFPVLFDLGRGVAVAVRRRQAIRHGRPNVRRHRLSLHSRLALITSAVMIVGGTVGIFVCETLGRPDIALDPGAATMRWASWGQRLLDSLFLSVSTRTAGFNAVAISPTEITPGTHMMCCLLMFVGGSPASTAGGVKTIAIAVITLGVLATIFGRHRVEVFGRQIPDATVRRSAVIILAMFGLQSVVMLTLAVTEEATLAEVMFETVSACNTVGLSLGITPDLTVGGRVMIMIAMFAGRLGPLTLLIALAGKAQPTRYEYPAEDVGLG
jgi:trk system potassium uptake protein TrkH